MVTIKNILKYQSFKNATLITGEGGMNNEVNGVMVMEAPDIETWGRKNLLILTSYYAMENVSQKKIDLFFRHAKRIGIGGFVVKVDRLVHTIPPVFVESCEKYQIPLIQIDKKTNYEMIIKEILETIINRNAYMLQSYYDVHKQFSQLMLSQPEIIEILQTLKNLLSKPVMLVENVKEKVISTDPQFDQYTISEKRYLPQKQFMNYHYQQYLVSYENYFPEESFPLLSISVPHLGYEEYELIVHELEDEIKDIDFMAIENAITALQIELVKRYAIQQNSRSRLNEMASDLLHGRLNNQDDIDDTIYQLKLDPAKRYRIILFDFELDDANLENPAPILTRFSDALIRHARIEFPENVYVTRKQKVILIAPTHHFSLTQAKQKVQTMLNKIMKNELYRRFKTYTTFSNDVWLHDLSEGYRQAVDTQKILQLTHYSSKMASYQDMGIYQIFVETENLDKLHRFIPETIWRLQEESVDLLKTLYTFIDVNQNYSEAAQRLFIHPKTVRYRINRLREQYFINFEDPEEILRYSIGLRLFHLAFENQS